MESIVPKAVDSAFSGMAYDARHSPYLRRFGGQDPAKSNDAVQASSTQTSIPI